MDIHLNISRKTRGHKLYMGGERRTRKKVNFGTDPHVFPFQRGD